MKASVASGVLVLLVMILVVANALYVDHLTQTLSDMVTALPDEPSPHAAEQIAAILNYLEKKETVLCFSVPFPSVDRGVELCKSLRQYAEDGSVYDYAATKIILLDAIEDMGRLERVAWKNIF